MRQDFKFCLVGEVLSASVMGEFPILATSVSETHLTRGKTFCSFPSCIIAFYFLLFLPHGKDLVSSVGRG